MDSSPDKMIILNSELLANLKEGLDLDLALEQTFDNLWSLHIFQQHPQTDAMGDWIHVNIDVDKIQKLIGVLQYYKQVLTSYPNSNHPDIKHLEF